jgi:ATP-dependent protease ClpP protease subunit
MADHNASFLFHPSSTMLTMQANGQVLHDFSQQIDTLEDSLAAIYRDRTKLPPETVARFRKETVIYTADQAMELGITQHVTDLQIPGNDQARIIFIE